MRMKDHLINKKTDNRFSIFAHRIILLVLLIIIIYQFTFEKMSKFSFLYLNHINLYINLIYYLLCFFLDLYKKDTKKSYQIYFHFCFSISSSLPFIYLLLGIMHLGEQNFFSKTSFISIGIILSPIIFNIMETLIIKRYRPSYINPIFLILFLTLYYCIIYFLGKLGIDFGEFFSKIIIEIKYIIPIYIVTIIGAFLGWWIYQIVTRPKIRKIDFKNKLDSSELSEE